MHSSAPPSLCLAVRAGTDGTRGTRTHQESPSMPKAQPPAAPPGPVSCLLPRGPCEVLNGLTINFHGLLCGEWLLPVPGVPCLSPRVALWLRSRVQPQLWWPQNTGIILWHSHSRQHSGKWGSQQEQPAPGEAARHRSTTLAQGRGAEAVPSRKLSQLSRPPWHGAIPQECPRSLLQEPALLGRHRVVRQSGVKKNHFLQQGLLCSTFYKMC